MCIIYNSRPIIDFLFDHSLAMSVKNVIYMETEIYVEEKTLQ